MKQKYEYINIHLFELDILAKHFEEMAIAGWMLKKIGMQRITYQECEPQRVHFIIDIYHKGAYLNPSIITKDEQSYGDFISEYGYELVTRTTNFQVFLSFHDDLIPISYDDDEISKKRKYKTILKYEFYNYLLYLLVPLYFWIFSSNSVHNLSFYTTNLPMFLYMIVPFFFLFIVYRTYPLIKWLIVKDNYHIETSHFLQKNKWLNRAYIFIVIYLFMSFALSKIVNALPIFSVLIICSFGFFLLDPLLARKIKKYHSIITAAICVYVSLGININLFIIHASPSPSNDLVGTLTYQELQSDLPKSFASDLQYNESFILKEEIFYEYFQDNQDLTRDFDKDINFSYNLYTVKVSYFLNYFQDLALEKDYKYIVSSEDWTLYKKRNTQCLIWDNYILYIDMEVELTPTQISMLINKF